MKKRILICSNPFAILYENDHQNMMKINIVKV